MKRLSALGLVFTFAALPVVIITSMSSQAASNNQPSRPLGVTDPNHGTRPAGHMPAIQPRQTFIQSKRIPTFTRADVEKYLQTDAVAQDAAHQHLTHTITFMSAQTLSQMLHDDFSQDAPILCYVEFTGKQPFTLFEVRSPSPSSVLHFTKAYEVFDGQTGDLLTWGGML
jgi:hypothetical protein